MDEVKPGMYRHFKGTVYEVIGTGLHSESLEECVIYRGEDGKIWIRPKMMFLEEVTVDGCRMPRFEYLGNRKGFKP